MVAEVIAAVEKFRAGARQEDDITLVIVKLE
jgi:serine phosphatase RsbU (regulator of sigma subunit)